MWALAPGAWLGISVFQDSAIVPEDDGDRFFLVVVFSANGVMVDTVKRAAFSIFLIDEILIAAAGETTAYCMETVF